MFRPCWEGQYPGPSFLRLRHATSVVNVALTQVDSGRFSALDEDLDDTKWMKVVVKRQGFTANVRESTVNESPSFGRVPANVMSDAEGPTVGRRRLVLVSQQVAHTVMHAPSAVSGELHAESNVESIPADSESDTASLPGFAIPEQDAFIPTVEPLGSLAFSAETLAAMTFFDICEVEGEFLDRACVIRARLLQRRARSAMRFALGSSGVTSTTKAPRGSRSTQS